MKNKLRYIAINSYSPYTMIVIKRENSKRVYKDSVHINDVERYCIDNALRSVDGQFSEGDRYTQYFFYEKV